MALRKRLAGYGLLAFAALSAGNQQTGAEGAPAPVVAATGGVPAIDSAVPTPGNPGVPLRFGNVLPKTERVTLGGRVLRPGADYAMDYAAGVVYLYCAPREGDSVTVEYRYDRTKGPVSSAGMAGLPAARLSLLPGMGATLGLGVTERAADGSVLRTNLFGTNNDLKLGAASLTGVYMAGQRSKVGVASGLNFGSDKGGDASTETGDSSLLVQSFRLGVAGGALTIDRQDVSANFVGFSALRGGPFDDARLAQLAKERGLVRGGMALRGAKALGGALTLGQRSVSDGKGGVDWREYGYSSGGFKFTANTRRVDSTFARFKDLAEADRDQIAREVGLERGDFAGEFRSKTGVLTFASNSVAESATGQGATRREAKLDTARFGFDFGDQTVDSGFKRFDSLLGNEKAQWGLEAGLHRQWMGARAKGVLGAELAFRRENVAGPKGEFVADSASLRGKAWSLEHVGKSAASGFDRLGSLSGTELSGHAADIAAMYNGRPFARDANVASGDVEALKRSAGIARTFDRFAASPTVGTGKGLSVEATRLRLDGARDGATVETLALAGRNAAFRFRSLEVGESFGEIASLMNLERARLGEIKGLSRRDVQLDLKLAPKASLRFDAMTASVGKNEAGRTRVAYADPRLQFAYNVRRVHKTFPGASALVDDERDALAALAGYESREIALNWQAFKNLRLEYGTTSATNALDDRERAANNLAFDWRADPSLQVAYLRRASSESDPLKTIFAQSVERIGVSKRFGNAAGFEYVSEARNYEGTDAKTPDSRLTSLALEARVSPTTTLRAQRSDTDFSDGKKEQVATNSILATVTPRLGVSVSDTKIARTGEGAKDEAKRDYGMWYDFGKGVRLSYGYVRSLVGEDAGASTTTLAFGQNAGRTDAANVGSAGVANVNGTELGFGSAGSAWDDQSGRVQSFNNLRLKTTRPFGLLGLDACSLLVDMDTASDKAVWIRENRRIAFSGKMGGTALGVEYRGQTDPTGERGIDRTVTFKTDPAAKAPLAAALSYKQRTLPTNAQVAIRDLSLTARPAKGVEVTNVLQTNPETFRSDALLGSVPRGDRLNKWKVDFKGKDATFGGSWEELFDDGNRSGATTAGINLSLFTRSGSPFTVFYGIENRDEGDARRAVGRYSLSFDQRPGPNQTLSMFLGNLTYAGTTKRDDSMKDDSWTVRVNYQLRF